MPAWARKLSKTAERRIQSRRKHPRALVDWPVTVISTNASCQGKAVNISRGGALIHLKEELDLGDTVRLAFEIPDYQDVIVAKGEILRTFSLKRGAEQEFSHGVALKFTDITDENLKFFSGNLAPEWRDDYIDSGPIEITKSTQNHSKYTRYITWALVFILFIPASYFFYTSTQKKLEIENSLSEIHNRLLIIEEQISSFKKYIDSFEALESDINDLQIEVSRLKYNLPEAEILETISLQLGHQNHQIEYIYHKIDNLEASNAINTVPDQHVQEVPYYVVKKGDNLHQISLKSGITIRELKEINKLDSNNVISPGQKLMLE